MPKEQFNTRIPALLTRNTRIVAAALKWTVEDLTSCALASFLGSTDKALQEKQKIVAETSRDLNLSFNNPDCTHSGFAFSV